MFAEFYLECLYFSFRCLFGTAKATLFVLIVIFGFIPVLFRYAYPLQRTIIFLNFGKCKVCSLI